MAKKRVERIVKPRKRCCKSRPRCKRCPVVCKRLVKRGLATERDDGRFVLSVELRKKHLEAARG
jgi:aldehyde:ferredoxin oxidoreductase